MKCFLGSKFKSLKMTVELYMYNLSSVFVKFSDALYIKTNIYRQGSKEQRAHSVYHASSKKVWQKKFGIKSTTLTTNSNDMQHINYVFNLSVYSVVSWNCAYFK